MISFSMIYAAAQAQPEEALQEGIPYWTFWLLLCIILLLTIFIFLRDKNLRQKLNAFFFRIKKKLIKLRLRTKMKKEKGKKAELIKNLGQKAIELGIKASDTENIDRELTKLEDEKKLLNKDLKDIDLEIKTLRTALGGFISKREELIKNHEAEKETHQEKLVDSQKKQKQVGTEVITKQKSLEKTIKEITTAKKDTQELEKNTSLSDEGKKAKLEELKKKTKSFEEEKEKIDQIIKHLVEKNKAVESKREAHQEKINEHMKTTKTIEDEVKRKTKEFNKEILEWEKNREKAQERIQKIEVQKGPLFKDLGKQINKERIDHKELVIFYSQIDRKNKRIEEIEKQIEELG